MSLRSWVYKVFLAPGSEENPPISQVAQVVIGLEKRLADIEKVSWRNDKRMLRAFGAIPVDENTGKEVELANQQDVSAFKADRELPAQHQQEVGEGEPTLNTEQIQQMLRR